MERTGGKEYVVLAYFKIVQSNLKGKRKITIIQWERRSKWIRKKE